MIGVQNIFISLLFLHSCENTSSIKLFLWFYNTVPMAHLLMLILSNMLSVNLDKSFYSHSEIEACLPEAQARAL